MLMTLHYLVLALEVLIECYQFVKSLVNSSFIKFNSKKSMCVNMVKNMIVRKHN